MKENNFSAIDEFSESEDEFEFELYSDNLSEVNINEYYSDSDTSGSDVIVHRSLKARPIESDTDDNASISSEEDDWVSIQRMDLCPKE